MNEVLPIIVLLDESMCLYVLVCVCFVTKPKEKKEWNHLLNNSLEIDHPNFLMTDISVHYETTNDTQFYTWM